MSSDVPISLRARCAICGSPKGSRCQRETILYLAPVDEKGERIINLVAPHEYTEQHQSNPEWALRVRLESNTPIGPTRMGICHCKVCMENRRIEWAEYYLLHETDPDWIEYWEMKVKERRL